MNALRGCARVTRLLAAPHARRKTTGAPAARIDRPLSQPTCFTHADLMGPTHVTPGISRAEYITRRHALADALPDNSLSIFPSNPQTYMSEDVPYLYHHNTDLMYVAGITEPGALLLAERVDGRARYLLFVEPRDPSRELWDGPLCGTGDDVRSYFGVHDVRHSSELPPYLAAALPRIASFHFDTTINPSLTALLRNLSPAHQNALVAKWHPTNPKNFLLHHRLIKSPAELHLMRQAASIMSRSLNHAMSKSRPPARESVSERYIEALLEFGCKTRGATRMAFPSVVASGTNGTILHYMNNDCAAVAGDFVMVDAGCELHGYSSDVSRSWPISGNFTSPQRDLYSLVLSVQKRCIELSVEGAAVDGRPVTLDAMHIFAVRELTDGLLQLGFMRGHSVESAITSGEYVKYFPHATGHYLGMDVHDTHQLSKGLALQAGMVVTVEPGLYCRVDDETAPEAFRGIGIRIEDDVVVGTSGHAAEVLSNEAVKEVDQIEALVGSGK